MTNCDVRILDIKTINQESAINNFSKPKILLYQYLLTTTTR